MAQRMAGEKLKEHGIGTERMSRPTSEGGTKGTLTAAATKHDMGVQEFATHVLANKDDYTTKMIRKASFARAATKFNH
jgi:hypothetical protein